MKTKARRSYLSLKHAFHLVSRGFNGGLRPGPVSLMVWNPQLSSTDPNRADLSSFDGRDGFVHGIEAMAAAHAGDRYRYVFHGVRSDGPGFNRGRDGAMIV